MAEGNYTALVTSRKLQTELPAAATVSPNALTEDPKEPETQPGTAPVKPSPEPPEPSRVLALDTASPVVSVALAARVPMPAEAQPPGAPGAGATPAGATDPGPSTVLARRSVELTRSSRRLLEMVDEILRETGLAMADLDAVVALAGPGSFTGLRVGLATVLGFHQALGLRATALPTLDVLAAVPAVPGGAAAEDGGPQDAEDAVGPPAVEPASRVVALVDVLRGEWAARPYRAGWPPVPEGEAERLRTAELARFAPCTFIGFGLGALEDEGALVGLPRDELLRHDLLRHPPGCLAPVAARLALEHPPGWEPERLVEPIYFRPPAVTLPRPHQGRRPGE